MKWKNAIKYLRFLINNLSNMIDYYTFHHYYMVEIITLRVNIINVLEICTIFSTLTIGKRMTTME